jgi:hypothetical protein
MAKACLAATALLHLTGNNAGSIKFSESCIRRNSTTAVQIGMIEFTGKDFIHGDIQYEHDEPTFTTEETFDCRHAVKCCPDGSLSIRTRPLLRLFVIQPRTVIQLALVAQHLFSRQRITSIRERIRSQHKKYPESPSCKPSDLGPKLRLLSTLLEADPGCAPMRGVRNVPGKS